MEADLEVNIEGVHFDLEVIEADLKIIYVGDLGTFEVKIEAVNDKFEIMEAADVNMEAIEVNYKADFN